MESPLPRPEVSALAAPLRLLVRLRVVTRVMMPSSPAAAAVRSISAAPCDTPGTADCECTPNMSEPGRMNTS